MSIREVATALTLIWAMGSLLMLARLSLNCLRVLQLRRSACAMQDDRGHSLLTDIATKLRLRRAPLLLVSNRAIAPLAVGLGRGAIILPERLLHEVDDAELRDILVHETAHLRRGDQWIVLLGELAGALYWPIVSVHALARELRRASEELCDNIVLAGGRDATGYGATLLHVAETLVNERAVHAAAAGILGGHGRLERRIAGLIDPKRSMRTNTGRAATCTVASLFIVAGVVAATTRSGAPARAADASAAAAATTQAASSTQPQSNRPPSEEVLKRIVKLRGRVVGPDDRPVAGARIYLSADPWKDPIELGASGADGAYRFELPEKSFHHYVDGSVDQDVKAALIAVAQGFGSTWAILLPVGTRQTWQMMKPEYEQDLKLAEDLPLQGQIVDAQGKPRENAVVAVECIFPFDHAPFSVVLGAMTSGEPDSIKERFVYPDSWKCPLHRESWQVIAPAITDAEGRFQIRGIGRDRAVKLAVSGPGMRNTDFSVLLTRRDDAEPFAEAIRKRFPRTPQPDGYSYPPRPKVAERPGARMYGPSPVVDVDPARTISGTVRDAKTGEPMADVRIHSGWMDVQTDRNGRYRLMRSDEADIVRLQAQPDRTHHLIVVKRLEGGKSLGELVVDFDLPRGVQLKGRVLEAGTDRPIVSAPITTCHAPWPGPLRAGRVSYYPLATNTALRGTPIGLYFHADGRSNWDASAVIDADGRFQMAIPPGPGVLLVNAYAGSDEFWGVGTSKESDGLHLRNPYVKLTTRFENDGGPQGSAQSFPGFNRPIAVEMFHAYQVINPPADATELDVTINVPRAPTRKVRFVGPDGKPMAGVKVRGMAPNWLMVVLDDAEGEVIGLEPRKPRELIAFSGDDKFAARGFVLPGESQEPMTIRLEPASAITGRIVDQYGKPVKALISAIQPSFRPDPSEIGMAPQAKTDADGRFRVAPLLPGLRYYAEIRGGETHNEVRGPAFEDVVLRSGEERDLGEIKIKPPEAK